MPLLLRFTSLGLWLIAPSAWATTEAEGVYERAMAESEFLLIGTVIAEDAFSEVPIGMPPVTIFTVALEPRSCEDSSPTRSEYGFLAARRRPVG